MLSYRSTINGQDLNTILNRFTDQNVKLRQKEKSDALRSWQPIVDSIVDFVRQRDAHRRFVKLKIVLTGSYYERAKVGAPDEFDLMLEIENLELDAAPYEEYENDGMSEPPTGFTRVMIDKGEEVLWQREGCANSRGMLKATQIKAVFARIVREAVSYLGYQREGLIHIHQPRQVETDVYSFVVVKSEGPAVTLKITRNGKEYSIDLTLAIKDNSWPEDAEEWRTRHRNGWPSHDLVREICQDGCHLVAKQPKGITGPDNEKGFFWRFSFSTAEKKLFLRGGHGEASSCRKQVLRILKALKEELSLHPLKSYHLKTLLLYECEAYPHSWEWSFDCLSERFLGLLFKLEGCLRQKKCPHYFIRNFNLLEPFSNQSCLNLAERIKQIRQDPKTVLSNLIGQH